MPCNNLSTTRQAALEDRLTQLESSLSKAYAAYDAALDTEGVSAFKFDSGEASQSANYHSLQSIEQSISFLESRIDYTARKLNGRANVILALRRKYSTLYSGGYRI